MSISTALHPPGAARDTLLRTTLVILRIAQIICVAACVGFVVFFLGAFISAWVKPAVFEHVLLKGAFGSTLLGFAITGLAAIVAASFSFLLVSHLIKIAQSVGDGNPFITENADRLHKIAYLSGK